MPPKKTTTPAAAAEALKDQGVIATTEPGGDGSPVPPVPDDDKADRVAMTSLKADGTPDQTPDHEVLVPGGDATAEQRRAAHPRGERNIAPPGGGNALKVIRQVRCVNASCPRLGILAVVADKLVARGVVSRPPLHCASCGHQVVEMEVAPASETSAPVTSTAPPKPRKARRPRKAA